MPPRLLVFAAAGVCVGLNDVWRFPYLVVEHGSLWFPLLYVVAVLVLALPLLVAELALARLGHSRPAANFGFRLPGADAGALWQYAGMLVLAAVFLILSYSSVVAGWMMAYGLRSAAGGLEELSVGAARLVFDSLTSDPERLLGWHTLFVLALSWVAARGAAAGTGRYCKALVIGVFAAAVALAAGSLSGFGLEAFRAFDVSLRLSTLSGALALDAMTQAFYTLGVCMGAMMILGAQLAPDARVGRLALAVVGLDMLFVALACAGAVPLLASGEAAAPGISFAIETVPLALSGVPFGRLWLVLFFGLLFALVATTALVLMECLVCWLVVKTGRSRSRSAGAAGAAVWACGLLTLLSFSELSFEFEFVGEQKSFGLFDAMDIISAQILLPIIGLLMAVFVGWKIDKNKLDDVIGSKRAAGMLRRLTRYLAPVAVAVIFVTLVFGRVLPRV